MKTRIRRDHLLFILLSLCASCRDEEEAPLRVKTYAGSGMEWDPGSVPVDGPSAEAKFNAPTQIALYETGLGPAEAYVVDGNYYIRKIASTGDLSTLERLPVYFSDLSLTTTYNTFDVFVELSGRLAETHAEFETNGNHSAISWRDGEPQLGLAYDGKDVKNHLRSFTRNNSGDVLAGTDRGVLLKYNIKLDTLAGEDYGYADGPGKLARFKTLYDMVTDDAGNIYVADGDNHCIRKVTPDGDVTTFAGTNETGFADGIGNKARFNNPRGIAIDKNGILYVGDTGNHSIRRINQHGGVLTIAGHVQGFGDGLAVSAMFDSPEGLAIDRHGQIFVVDRGNNKIRIITTTN